jgi:hypothetical protein
MDVTSYDSTALAIVLPETAGVNGTIVFASAFDGNTFVPVTTTTTTDVAINSLSYNYKYHHHVFDSFYHFYYYVLHH